ncbi:SGNH hydrolase-type esterase domain-containing protein [Xylariales sp. PMI_506]|nr:SGNH hydrolase-type esterase domain-containing protein [Xylariales sp. PMI_506]
MPLRVMFMGASITRGEVSAGDRGYRKHIRDWLVKIGNPVNCVGTQRFGTFPDNDVEGYSAARISQLWEHAKKKVPSTQPNLILVQVGTSDCFQKDQENPTYVFQRYRAFVDWLFETTPRATIILSTIVTTPREDIEPCVLSANAQIRQVAADLEREGKPIAIAEMHYSQGLPNRPTRPDIGADQIHPTNEGYIMMGDIFIEKIREVDAKGFLQPPVENGIPEDGEAENIAIDERRKAEEAKKAQEKQKAEAEMKAKEQQQKAEEQPKTPVEG